MPVRVLNVHRCARSAGGGVIMVGVRAVGGRSLAVAERLGCECAFLTGITRGVHPLRPQPVTNHVKLESSVKRIFNNMQVSG
jgi:hypothetical protein